MKRDMKLIHKMILELEKKPNFTGLNPQIDGYTDEEIDYHAYLLMEEGLAEGNKHLFTFESHYSGATVTKLTPLGYQLVDRIRYKFRNIIKYVIITIFSLFVVPLIINYLKVKVGLPF